MENEEYQQIIQKFKEDNKELIDIGKCRKCFTEILPISNHNGGSIDWKNSIHYKVYFIDKNISGYIIIIDYKSIGQTLTVSYLQKTYKIKTVDFKNCKLGNIVGTKTSSFKYKIGQRIKDDKRDIIITNCKNEKGKSKLYQYNCNICGFDCGEHYSTRDKEHKKDFWITENHIKDNRGCACCNSTIIVKEINSIFKTNPEMAKYFLNIEDTYIHSESSNRKVYVKCKECGKPKKKKITVNSFVSNDSIGCEYCGDGKSYAEKFMFNILTQLNVDFIPEYSPEWIGLRRYDFYIPSLNLIIEMDGGWHENDNEMSGQSAKESKSIDDYKDKMALLHGIKKPIRIDCNYRIKKYKNIKNNILNSDLNCYFDLNKVDFKNADEKSHKPIVREACDLWNSGIHSTGEIGKILKISSSCVLSHLKKGKALNWCDYTTEDSEKFKVEHIKKVTGNNCKELIVFKDDFIGVYPSAMYIDKNSEELFGVKLNFSKICAVCRGVKPQYKGFTFKYTSDLTEEEIKQIQDNAKLNQ